MEIHMGEDGSIQLKKYSSVGGLKDMAEEYVLLSAEGGPALSESALQSLKTGALYLGKLLSV